MGYSRKFCVCFLTLPQLLQINIFSINPTITADTSDNNSLNYIYQSSGDFRGPKSSDCLSIQSIDSVNYSEQNRCASVKSRPAARRISAAELEHLMIRQGTSQFQPIHYEQVGFKLRWHKNILKI